MTRRHKTVLSQVKGGLRLTAIVLLMVGWLGLVFGGMAIALTPSPHSPVVGWGLLVIAAVILVLTMDRWVRVLPGILAYGILGGILTILSGHALNQPSVNVPRVEGVIMTILIAGSAAVSFTFTKRKLDLFDRLALLAFVFCFFWQAALRHFVLVPLAIGFCFLAAAWGYARLRHRLGRDGGTIPGTEIR